MTEYKLNGVRVDLRRKKYSQEKLGLLWPSMSHICEPSFLPVLLWGAGSVRAMCGMLMLSGICLQLRWGLMWIQEEVDESHSVYQTQHEKIIPVLQSGFQ